MCMIRTAGAKVRGDVAFVIIIIIIIINCGGGGFISGWKWLFKLLFSHGGGAKLIVGA